MIAAGLSLKEIADQLGHADATLTLTTYGHLFDEALESRRLAVERVHERLAAADATAPESEESGSPAQKSETSA